MPHVWTFKKGSGWDDQKNLTEPYIPNFEKFNSNTGATNYASPVARALSHFSYHATDGAELLCDLQGGKVGKDYVLSDIVVMSNDKKYGLSDLGALGIENFFSQHHCNEFCCPSWKRFGPARQHFQPVMSTTLVVDQARVPTPIAKQKFEHLWPSEIMFTQGSIKGSFRCGKSLLQVANVLASEDNAFGDIPKIQVVKTHGKYYTLDNRRLAVFRCLEMRGIITKIKCEVCPFASKISEVNRKRSTVCDGQSITVRGKNSHKIGLTKTDTTFPIHQISGRSSNSFGEVLQYTMFLGTLTDGPEEREDAGGARDRSRSR